MLNRLVADAWRMLWPILLGAIVSYSIKQWWVLVAVLGALLIWQIWQKWRLACWLARGKLLEPPHAGGLWEDYYTRLMHLFRHEQRAQKKLSDIIERARNVAESLDDGIVLLDTNFNLMYYNLAACELLGLAHRDKGEQLTNLVRHPTLHRYLETQSFHHALILPSFLKKMTLSIKVTPLAAEGFLLRVEDVTHIQTLESLRRDFVANVSHELKTPITVFKGSLELLLDQPNYFEPQYVRLLENMQQQSERMESLVGNLLLLATLEGHKSPTKVIVSIDALCNKLQTTFAEKARAKNQHLEWNIAVGLSLEGVFDEVESAFGNLIDNAISYASEGGVINVTCSKSLTELSFIVQDNGQGIDELHIPHLTERFYRIEKSRGRHSGGTGLGLAIVKHVMQRHHGKLVITSKLGQGSCFSCVFPLNS